MQLPSFSGEFAVRRSRFDAPQRPQRGLFVRRGVQADQRKEQARAVQADGHACGGERSCHIPLFMFDEPGDRVVPVIQKGGPALRGVEDAQECRGIQMQSGRYNGEAALGHPARRSWGEAHACLLRGLGELRSRVSPHLTDFGRAHALRDRRQARNPALDPGSGCAPSASRIRPLILP